jgi:hypothetical protein
VYKVCTLAVTAWLLAACASIPSPIFLLRLAPSDLGQNLAVRQQLTFTVGTQAPQQLDAYLEADATSVNLALMALGQTAARVRWDGLQLQETRAAWLPSIVSAERILSDLQLVLWPIASIAAALPAGWSVEGDGQDRVLKQGQTVVATVHTSTDTAELHHLRLGYRLRVVTQTSAQPPVGTMKSLIFTASKTPDSPSPTGGKLAHAKSSI